MTKHGDLIKREGVFYVYDIDLGWIDAGIELDDALELQKLVYDDDFE